MTRRTRQILAAGALALAAVATVATSPATSGPSIGEDSREDQVLLRGGEARSQSRKLTIEVMSSEAVQVRVDVQSDTSTYGRVLPVVLTVVRDSDGATLANERDAERDAAEGGRMPAWFAAFSCHGTGPCHETFTLTFTLAGQDADDNVRFDWYASVWVTFQELEPDATPPPGASITVRIGD